ncbi:MAG: Trp family transcriptional regulator [Patescibacteria group bacterium]
MKRKIKELSEEERIETLDTLYTATSALKGRAAMKEFLKDLLTTSERIMLGRRILIARRILSGESTLKIAKNMKVGFDTIYRVERWLQDSMPGYENAIAGLDKAQADRRKPKYPQWGTLAHLKKKYPLHFLLWPSK